ncbi:MAG: MFS transporter [Oscillospiraceae bacterium]|nr:MFS transporter [Oscillospiraceae bacterium]
MLSTQIVPPEEKNGLFTPQNKRWVFSLIYFFVWAGFATFMIEFLFYSQRLGMTNTQIGLLSASMGLAGMVMQPVMGYVCDYLRTTRKVIMVLLIFGVLFSLMLPSAGASGSIPAVIAVVAGYTVFMCSFMPLLDNWVARECIGQESFHYGSVRWWGSLSFAAAAYSYGRLSMTPYLPFAYYGRAFFLTLTLLCIFLYKYENIAVKQKKGGGQAAGESKPSIKALFSVREYILLMIFMFMISLAFTSSSSFFPALMLARGGNNAMIGMAGSINALIEIPFFLYSRRLTNRFGPRGSMLTGILFMCARLAGFAFIGSPGGILLAYFLVAPYVGLFQSGFIYYVYSIAPRGSETVAQTMIQAASMGLAGMLGSSLGGIVIDSLGIDILYRSAFIIAAAGLGLFAYTSVLIKRKGEKG